MYFKKTERKLKDLLNNESVVIMSDGFVFNTVVKWELADHLDDVPPFLEINFVERTEDEESIYYTKDLDQDVYDLFGVLFVLVDSE